MLNTHTDCQRLSPGHKVEVGDVPPEATPSTNANTQGASKMSSASPGGLIALPSLRATYILASRRFSSLAVWAPGRKPEV